MGLSSRVLASQTNEEAASSPSLKLKPRVRRSQARRPALFGSIVSWRIIRIFLPEPCHYPELQKKGAG